MRTRTPAVSPEPSLYSPTTGSRIIEGDRQHGAVKTYIGRKKATLLQRFV
jgi:hypothetical protein